MNTYIHTVKSGLVSLPTCPCPREMEESFLPNFIFSANLYKSSAGSVPCERMKMRGALGPESLKATESSAV